MPVKNGDLLHVFLGFLGMATVALGLVPVLTVVAWRVVREQRQRSLNNGRDVDELLAARDRFQQAFDNAPIGMVLADMTGRFVEVNSTFCDMLGRSEDELVGNTSDALTHPEDVAKSAEIVSRASSGTLTSSPFEKRYRHADGSDVWVKGQRVSAQGHGGQPCLHRCPTGGRHPAPFGRTRPGP